jgi:hypothetical protein
MRRTRPLGEKNGIDEPISSGVALDWYGCAAWARQGVNAMLGFFSDDQLALLLVFCVILVPALLACIVGFFLSHRSHAGRQLGGVAKKPAGAGRSPHDTARYVRATIDRAGERLVQSAAEYKYVFPWTLTALDADEKIVFTRQYIFDSAQRHGLRVEEIVSSPSNTLPRFPVAFRLVDATGQDITWSIGVAGHGS